MSAADQYGCQILLVKHDSKSQMEFSTEEKTDMLVAFILAGKSGALALRDYSTRFPDRRQPSKQYFSRLERSLRNFGRFDVVMNGFPKEELETIILAHAQRDPESSSREIAYRCGVTHPIVLMVLRKHGMKPYKLSKVQQIRGEDLQRRADFCNWFLTRENADPQFSSKILWTDEANFSNRGFFNRKNTHLWAIEKPNEYREANAQVRFGFNIWCGLLGSRIIGPHFYQGTLTASQYQRFIQDELIDFMEEIPLGLRRCMIFMQDGAPAHNARRSLTLLKETFPGGLLATNGDFRWPARSPDLTPMDFYLWGRVKDLVYSADNIPFTNLDELKRKVEETFDRIEPEEIRAATRSVSRRCRLCLSQAGAQFEQLR